MESEENSEKSIEPLKISLRAERSGIGSLLSSLRSEKPAEENVKEEIEEAPQQTEIEEKEKIPEFDKTIGEKEVEEPSRPLNRREKRKLQREMQEKGEIPEIEEKIVKKEVEPAKIPKKLEVFFCDSLSFTDYLAVFGNEYTRTNNYPHFAIQNSHGTRAIVGSQDRHLRMFQVSEEGMFHVLWKHNTGNLILDAMWEKSGNGLFSTSKLRPIQLYDSESGEIVGTYNGKDSADNIQEAMCLGQSGNTLIGGFRKHFQLWDINCTGDAASTISYFDKNYNTGMTGIGMSIDCHPTMPDLFAAVGSSSIASIYSLNWKNAVSTIGGSQAGYTHVRFSPDGVKVYASERKGDIHCFDTRMNMLTQVIKREMTVNHRSRFDLDPTGRLLYSGTSSGNVVVYDLDEPKEEIEPILTTNVASICVPCVSVRNKQVVLCTGQREYPEDLKPEFVFKNTFQICKMLY